MHNYYIVIYIVKYWILDNINVSDADNDELIIIDNQVIRQRKVALTKC